LWCPGAELNCRHRDFQSVRPAFGIYRVKRCLKTNDFPSAPSGGSTEAHPNCCQNCCQKPRTVSTEAASTPSVKTTLWLTLRAANPTRAREPLSTDARTRQDPSQGCGRVCGARRRALPDRSGLLYTDNLKSSGAFGGRSQPNRLSCWPVVWPAVRRMGQE